MGIRCSRSRETSGDARNDQILTNSATKILNGVAQTRGVSTAQSGFLTSLPLLEVEVGGGGGGGGGRAAGRLGFQSHGERATVLQNIRRHRCSRTIRNNAIPISTIWFFFVGVECFAW